MSRLPALPQRHKIGVDPNRPEPGYWMMRQHPRGPEVPAAIVWVHTTFEPNHPENIMDRSPFLAAFISGRPTDWWRVWHRSKRPISEPEYKFEMARLGWLREWQPGDPALKPHEPVDYLAMGAIKP
jgi:hypothetical protein